MFSSVCCAVRRDQAARGADEMLKELDGLRQLDLPDDEYAKTHPSNELDFSARCCAVLYCTAKYCSRVAHAVCWAPSGGSRKTWANRSARKKVRYCTL